MALLTALKGCSSGAARFQRFGGFTFPPRYSVTAIIWSAQPVSPIPAKTIKIFVVVVSDYILFTRASYHGTRNEVFRCADLQALPSTTGVQQQRLSRKSDDQTRFKTRGITCTGYSSSFACGFRETPTLSTQPTDRQCPYVC